MRAVQPLLSLLAFTWALWASKVCTVVVSPFSAAYIKAVRPFASRACTSAPLASRARVVGVSPLLTALIKGGGSLLERLTILQPSRRRKRLRSTPTSRKGQVLSGDKRRNACVVITGSTFHQIAGSIPISHTVVPCRVFLRPGRLMLLQYSAARLDIPSLRLACDIVPQWCSRLGKITALTIAFIVPTEIRKQLQ